MLVLLTGGTKWLARLDFLSLAALIFYFAMGHIKMTPFRLSLLDEHKVRLALVTLAGVLFVSTIAHLFKHWGLATDGYDVGFVNQPLFYPFGPSPMWCVLCPNNTYLAEHLVLSFYLIAPLTTLFKSDEFIILLQYIFVLAPILALMWKGPLKNKKELWLFAVILILAHRSLRNGLVFDFREDQIAFAGFLLSCVSFYNRKIFFGFISLFVAMASKENMSLVSFFMAAPILFDENLNYSKRERYVYASVIATVSMAWFALTFTHVMPYFRAGAQTDSVILMRLPGLGTTPLEIILNSIKNPLPLVNFVFDSIFTFGHLKYFVILLFPFAMFSWRAWPWLIPALPGIGMNLISAVPNQRFMTFHYDFNILPFLFFAGLYGISKAPVDKLRKSVWPLLLLALTFAGRSPMLHVTNYFSKMRDNISHERFLNSIESDEVVGMSMRSVGQLSHIKNFRVLNFPVYPPSGDETDFEKFLIMNRNVRMKSGLLISDYTHLVLDSHNSWEKRLIEIYLEVGEVVLNDNRFFYLRIN